MFECTERFVVSQRDGDGFLIEDAVFIVEVGSRWMKDNTSFRVVGGDVRLESDEYGWLEISKEDFQKHFKNIN